MSATPYNDHKSGEPGEMAIHFRMAATTNGTVGALGFNRGFGTPTRTGTGTYKLPLDRSYYAFLGGHLNVEGATVTSGKASRVRIVSETLTGSDPNITFECLAADGSIADVSTNHIIFGTLTFKTGSF